MATSIPVTPVDAKRAGATPQPCARPVSPASRVREQLGWHLIPANGARPMGL